MNVRNPRILFLGLMLVLLIPRLSFSVTRYVSRDNPFPQFPYDAWTNAANNIQDAVDAAQNGEIVLVTNGVYREGSRIAVGLTPNRVVIDKPISVRSIAGPAETVIEGSPGQAGGNGEGAVRCVYVGSNAVLRGFTFTNGHTLTEDDVWLTQSGGGAWCEPNASISNCVFVKNSAILAGGVYRGIIHNSDFVQNLAHSGGGVYNSIVVGSLMYSNSAGGDWWGGYGGGANGGTLTNCLLIGNYAYGDGAGAYNLVMDGCIVVTNYSRGYGGGVSWVKGYNSRILGNWALGGGGGDYHSTLCNCVLAGNIAESGGGSTAGTLNNCTVTGNTATNGAGGIANSAVTNCIVYFNNAPRQPNHYLSTIAYSCTDPIPTNGLGNLASPPLFANATSGDYQLAFGSPCIDTGMNLSGTSTNDLNGNLRPMDGNGDGLFAYDMGAYEFGASLQPTATNGYLNISFHTIWGVTYVVESSESPAALLWNQEEATVGNGDVRTYSFPMDMPMKVYRLRLK